MIRHTWRGSTRRAMTMLEILVVVILLAFAIIPLIGAGQSTTRQTFFAEYQLVAMSRAKMVLDLACAIDFELYDALSKKTGGTQTPIEFEKLLPAGALEGLYAAAGKADAYTIKLSSFRHSARFTRVDEAVGRIDVDVDWSYPGDRAGVGHKIHLSRIVHRKEVGTNQRYALQ